MEAKTGVKKNGTGWYKSIRLRIFLVIIVAASVITASALAAGAWLLTRDITSSIEEHLLVAVDIADQFVTKEIEVIKLRAADAAKDIRLLYNAGRSEDILALVGDDHPLYVGLAVFDNKSMVDSWGKIEIPPDLINEPFMRIAITGGHAISTTMHSPCGDVVMYVSTPISDELILAAVLPGLHLSGLVSQFGIYQTGHIFVADEKGVVISNPRPQWVQTRINFIDLAETNSNYIGLGTTMQRIITGERGTAHFITYGVPRISAFRPVSSGTQTWFMGVIAPTTESPLNNIPSSILLMGIITITLSITAAIIAANMLKRTYIEVDRLRLGAETASISKSAFLAHMSHEIRTPMNSIVGFSELAIDDKISSRTRGYLTKIIENSEWLLQIINDILDISKIESGKMELEKIPFDLHDLFASCRTLVTPKAIEKGVTVYFYAEPTMGKCPMGDPTKLRQVLVNLLSNAVKFTNAGTVKLNAVIREKGEKTITMYFEVKDSGIGMTPEQMEKIFKPFAQAESGTTRKYGGTGLGLAITKEMLELMGGKLTVESAFGIGSKFSFELTFDTVGETDRHRLERQITFSDYEKPIFEGEVLLCEDNAMNQQVISEHLARVGLNTVIASNGKIGLDMVQSRKEKGEKQFDLIFMDVHMPVMDGIEASSKILELNTGVPIIAMTANVMSTDQEIYRASGMNDCVGKPFTSQELWSCLMKYLKPVDTISRNEADDFPPEKDILPLSKSQREEDMGFKRRMQVLFLENNQNIFKEVTEALEAGDIKLACMIIHTLKSNAGHIEKNVLYELAADAEYRLKDGENRLSPENLNMLESELNNVLAELKKNLKES